VNTRIDLATTRKGTSTVIEYFGKMKALGDEMAASGRPLDEELIEYNFTGLDDEYTPLVSALCARKEPISVSELYSQMLNFEIRIGLFQEGNHYRSVNAANRRGSRGMGGSHGHRGGRASPADRGTNTPTGHGGFDHGFGRGRGRSSNYTDPVICQVCGKKNHTAAECWQRFDESYTPDQKFAHAASSSCNVDTNWYMDSGATDHITGELEKLTVRNKYQGGDQIHMASEAGMDISHIGHAVVNTPHRPIQLNNILYVPRGRKNLISIHRLTIDNSIFIELHPFFFLIKDQKTRRILLKGKCVDGIYPLPLDEIKQACSATRVSINTWHNRLGHASNRVVEQVIRRNNLLSSQESINRSVCDACQQAKSHQLPYSSLMSASKFPLELVYSDVWGPTPESVGRMKYYVSFIDDFSKFTWIYLIKFKSEVFQKFQEFQAFVERKFQEFFASY
jgi:hypothetical protein